MAPALPLRLGVIGAGWFASRRHCPDILRHPETTLSALCRRDPAELKKLAAHFGVEHCFADYRELIHSSLVDAVVICSPHHLHYEHTLAALEQGLHVLLEKPITIAPEEGHHLVSLAAERKLALVVGQNPPYWSHCRFLREQIAAGTLGTIESAHVHWVGNAKGVLGLEALPADLPGVVRPSLFRGDAAQNGGGFLMDGGSHLISELLWCTGLRVAEVSALMDNPRWDLRAALDLRLSNGALATLSILADSGTAAKRQHSIYYGSAGTAELRGFPFTVSIATGKEELHRREDELPAPPTPVADLVECILRQGQPAMAGELAVHVVEIIQAAYDSARSAQVVKL
ncbi:MAG: Gfo/Idh/MocA family oxidoreductase [Candidatus Latescibacteria bacterium]|nr:Gfo/Idh/MocA family oxidoreductase [Candidatus Latescibacterota bacterium]